jgi:hypothetical protein
MSVLLKLMYDFIIKKSLYNHGWKHFIIYPFIWLWYKLKVKYVIHKFIESPNNIIDFKEAIIEYICFLTVLKNTIYADFDTINDIIKYKDTTKIFAVYDDNEKIKTITYRFTEQSSNISIRVDINEQTNLTTISIKALEGTTTFSFNSFIDSRLVSIKSYAEKIIRTDMAANLNYLLLEKI